MKMKMKMMMMMKIVMTFLSWRPLGKQVEY